MLFEYFNEFLGDIVGSKNGISLITHIVGARLIVALIVAVVGGGNGSFRLA